MPSGYPSNQNSPLYEWFLSTKFKSKLNFTRLCVEKVRTAYLNFLWHFYFIKFYFIGTFIVLYESIDALTIYEGMLRRSSMSVYIFNQVFYVLCKFFNTETLNDTLLENWVVKWKNYKKKPLRFHAITLYHYLLSVVKCNIYLLC